MGSIWLSSVDSRRFTVAVGGAVFMDGIWIGSFTWVLLLHKEECLSKKSISAK